MIEPTKRFVIDVGRKCSINCKFCYYHHLGDLRNQTFKNKDTLIKDIDRHCQDRFKYMDVTGGEPSIYPDMPELISYAKEKGITTCIITNALAGENTFKKIIDAGVKSFLISMHGTEDTHNYLIDMKDGFKRQERTLKQIQSAGIYLRFNCVINKYNQEQIFEMSEYMNQWKPKIVNFINMNLHHGWKHDIEAENIIADLRIVEPLLDKSIEMLEQNNTGVNVRYYPMCRIAEKYRRCICNDLHVEFDPWEWRYISSRDFDTVRKHWIDESNRVEEKGKPCDKCDLQWICGGANKYWHKISQKRDGEILTPQKVFNQKTFSTDFYYYRKNNIMTLESIV